MGPTLLRQNNEIKDKSREGKLKRRKFFEALEKPFSLALIGKKSAPSDAVHERVNDGSSRNPEVNSKLCYFELEFV